MEFQAVEECFLKLLGAEFLFKEPKFGEVASERWRIPLEKGPAPQRRMKPLYFGRRCLGIQGREGEEVAHERLAHLGFWGKQKNIRDSLGGSKAQRCSSVSRAL